MFKLKTYVNQRERRMNGVCVNDACKFVYHSTGGPSIRRINVNQGAPKKKSSLI
jgi:hypothetical protein